MIENDEAWFVVRGIHSKWPNADFTVGDTYDSLNWNSQDQDKPTEEEFNNAVTAYKAEYDAQAYARARKDEYPSYAEQFDILYHKGVAGLKAELKKTKDKYPKLKTQQ